MTAPDVTGRRVGAGLIDIGIVVALLFLIAGIFGTDAGPDASVTARLGPRDRALFFILTFAYFFGTEAVWAQTLGKRALNLHVRAVDGSKPTSTAVLVRNVLRFVDWLPFLYIVGAIAVFTTGPKRQRIGDLAAKTRVVAVDAPPDEPDAPPPPPDDEDVLAQVLR